MHFAVQRDTLVRALKDVTSALATRVVQPILSNVLIESIDETTVKFQATDLDLSIDKVGCSNGLIYGHKQSIRNGFFLLQCFER